MVHTLCEDYQKWRKLKLGTCELNCFESFSNVWAEKLRTFALSLVALSVAWASVEAVVAGVNERVRPGPRPCILGGEAVEAGAAASGPRGPPLVRPAPLCGKTRSRRAHTCILAASSYVLNRLWGFCGHLIWTVRGQSPRTMFKSNNHKNPRCLFGLKQCMIAIRCDYFQAALLAKNPGV